jgi:O-antigen ligase
MIVLVCLAVRTRMIALSHVLALTAVLGVFVSVATIAYPAAFLRITESDERSSEARWAMMDQALLIIRRNPMLGVGYGGYNRAAQTNVPESYAQLSPAFRDELLKGVVHNKYLLVAGEHGLIGLGLFLALLWTHVRLFFTVRHWRTRFELALVAGLTSAVAAQLVFYLFDHFYNDIRIEMLWVTFAVVVAVIRLQPALPGNRRAHALVGTAPA